MRLGLACCVLMIAACTSSNGKKPGPTCGSGIDPNSPQCNLPQCMNGLDDDGDGFIDYPNDPGCFSPNQDSEADDCPDGPNCPECGNGKDDDGNSLTDYPNDPGCTAASDTDEYTENPYACGNNVHILHLPFDNMVAGTYSQDSSVALQGSCGGAGIEDVYFLRLKQPKVVVASTSGSSTDTVLYIRSAMCTDATMELACNDNISSTDTGSTVTAALDPGTYYLVVDSNNGSVSNTYNLTVKFYVGEGTACTTGDDCGPGLLCKIPTGGSTKVCAKQNCRNGIDDDGDGKIDYPNDPGCTDPMDDDETDDCPNGPMCPECANGIDDDGDGKIDYPMDTQCIAASSTSEACPSHESVQELTMGTTMGDTTGATSDFNEASTCAFQNGVPDLTYRLDLPALNTLKITADTGGNWSPIVELLGATCGGTALHCNTDSITANNVAAGKYFLVVDGAFSTTDYGPFTLTTTGTIKAGASCESPLALSGALVCATGYACKGTTGSRTCQPAQCNDGIDNDMDGKIDFPNDPGCDSPGDDDETNGATPPVCANGTDDDGDGTTDWPADFGCTAASGTSEVFCVGEHDVMGKVTTKTSTGTTAGKANDSTPTCQSGSMGPDVSYALQLPVAVTSLQVDTIGTSFDTVLTFSDANCMTTVACDDDSGGSLTSKITLSNITAGGYAITIDGFSTDNGAYTLNVHGTVAAGTACTSPLFSGGTAAVLSCPTGTTCTSGKCQ